ncbi:MAG: hypothetical protein K0Q57_995 [Gammaproteobacteria bacterium]|jgi:hypothetical protein|nr:hypothetical protein [Gammaproteobacteria bacterium]
MDSSLLIRFMQQKDLNEFQTRGLNTGLSRAQVFQYWFTEAHAMAAERRIPYEEYKGLSSMAVEEGILKGIRRAQAKGLSLYQLRGIQAGLSWQQVKNTWFKEPHSRAAAIAVPYSEYQDLTPVQVEKGILKGLTRAQVSGLRDYQIDALHAGYSKDQVGGLTEYQMRGLKTGLNKDQVYKDWFKEAHAIAAEKGLPYSEYENLGYYEMKDGILKGLSRSQVEGLDFIQIQGIHDGLSREQVIGLNSSCQIQGVLEGLSREQVLGLDRDQIMGVHAGLSREQVLGLNCNQIEGLKAGLNRKQVTKYRFTESHAEAAKMKIPYHEYCNLDYYQVQHGILKGLTRAQVSGLRDYQIDALHFGLDREQVDHDWFTEAHAKAAESYPYEEYAGLEWHQVKNGILNGFSRAKVEGLNSIQMSGLNAGLSREQVNHEWFDYSHLECAESGVPYSVYAGKKLVYVSDINNLIYSYRGRLNARLALCMATHPRLGENASPGLKKLMNNVDLSKVLCSYLGPKL